MSERYSRLFSLPENLGQHGCPVVISAGALLKDNNTGKLLVQLKFRNISERIIKSVKIKVNAYDTAGCELKGVETFSYLDLAVGWDKEFGNRTPIILPDKTTRSFSVEILSVTFTDGTAYTTSIHIVAETLDGEILKTVQMLDNERKEQNEKQFTVQKEKYHKLCHLVYVPLIINILTIIKQFKWYIKDIDITYIEILKYISFEDQLFHLHLPILISLIVPCLSIFSYRKARHNLVLIKNVVRITAILSLFQIVLSFLGLGVWPFIVGDIFAMVMLYWQFKIENT